MSSELFAKEAIENEKVWFLIISAFLFTPHYVIRRFHIFSDSILAELKKQNEEFS